jgi:hypothetical protein
VGFIDRIGKIAEGFGGAIQAPFGLVTDLATAPWNDDEDFNGFINTVMSRTKARGGQFLGGQIAVAGAFGSPAGVVKRNVVDPALDGVVWAGRELASEPFQTLQYVSERSDPLKGGSPDNVLDRDTWSRGYELANRGDGSPGRNFAYGLFGARLDDDEARKRAEDTAGFGTLSGSLDAAFSLFADPTVVAGKAAGAARLAKLVKPIDESTDLDKVMSSSRFGRFSDAVHAIVTEAPDTRVAASRIRHQFFPNDTHGAAIATVLAEAEDMPTRTKVLALMMGDGEVLSELRERRADIAGQLARLTGEQSVLKSLDPENFARVNGGETGDLLRREIDTLYPEADRLARQEQVFGKIRNEPRARVMNEARAKLTRSDFYQRSKFAAPLRVTFNMQAHRLIDLNRADGDVQVSRLLQKSKLDGEQQLRLRGEYMAAQTPGQRQAALIKAEEAAVTSLATDAGMTADELQALLQEANKGRQTAAKLVDSRTYDGEGRSRFRFTDDVDGTTHEVNLPLLVSQEGDVLPLVDMDELRRAIADVRGWRKRFPSDAIPKAMIEGVYKVWKPSVLLRVGWPIRVVGDEQLRIMGKIGALASLKHLHAGISNSMANELDRASAIVTRAPGVSAKDAARQRPKNRIGQGTFKAGDYELEKAFGAADAQPNVFFDLSSSRDNFNRFVGQQAEEETRKLREATGEWRSISPDEKSYGTAWERAVNQQIGSDQMARQFLQGKTVDDVAKWLRATEEGRAYARRLPYRRANLTAWAGKVAEQVESYTLGNAELKALALKGNAKASDLARVAPDAATRPVVHGEILADALGKGPVAEWFNNTVQGLWKALGSKPSDTLSRHPYFSAVYEAEATRLTGLMDRAARKNGERLRESDLLDVQYQAREYALGETKKTLYSLAEQSDLAAMLKFVAPFYNAWQETMTVWAGIAIDNPAYIARLGQVWGAPEAAGIITDEEGNAVGPGDRPYDSEGNPTSERYVTVRLPRWAKDWPGMESVGTVKFNKRSFNLMLQGAPGFGPVVQVPVNEIVKDRPDLEKSVKFVLPFGSSQSSLDLFLPSTVKRLQSLARGEEDSAYRNALLRIYATKLVDYNTGKRETKPTYKEAKDETNKFFMLRAVASWVSPAAPGFQTPYQPYIDAYQQLKRSDPTTADEKFLAQYGDEYFPLTQSVTRSRNGIPPTVEAYKAGSKYADIIAEHPELGGLIVGAEGAGGFSRAVYNAQTATPLEPGSDLMQRQTFSPEEFAKQPSIRLGWIKYSKAMSLVEAARVARGLPNLRVKEANDLAVLKKLLTEKIEQEHPEWADKRAVFDRNAMQKRLTGLRELAADDRLAQRSEFQGLQEYFRLRDAVRAALVARGSSGGAASLDAASNQDIAFLWETLIGQITERNLAFGDLHARFLDRDMLEAA